MPRHTAAALLTYEELADALGLDAFDVDGIVVRPESRSVAVIVTGDGNLQPQQPGAEAVVWELEKLQALNAERLARGLHR